MRETKYESPNRFVSQEDRKNWCFKVKSYYKTLKNVLPCYEDGIIATDYLMKLFNLLSYGTHYLKFTSWSTFSRIGVHQLDYLSIYIIIRRSTCLLDIPSFCAARFLLPL